MDNTRNTKKKIIHTVLYRTELWFIPWLIFVPLLVSFLLIWDWYTRGFMMNSSRYNGELYLGLIILIGNIIFDIPLIKTVLSSKKTKTELLDKP